MKGMTLADLFIMFAGAAIAWTLCELTKYAVLWWLERRRQKQHDREVCQQYLRDRPWQ